jgi:lipopolysaccharide export system permease protein
MLILDRYLFGRFLKNFLMSMAVFVFLYIIIDVLSNLSDILKNHPPLIKVAEFYLYSVPTILSQTAPVASLLATLFTLGGFNQSNEVIAMRAAGLSIVHIVRPLIMFGLFLSLALFVMNETVTPYALKMSKEIKLYYIEKSDSGKSEKPIENVAVYGFNNRLFFINKLYPKSQTIEGLTILEHDEHQNVRSKIFAEKAVWRNNRWVLYQCFIYQMGEGQAIRGEPLYFTDKTIKIQETPDDFYRQNIPVDSMNARELSAYIAKLPEGQSGPAISRLKVDLYQKTSLPFTSLIIILLGIPSSIAIRGRAVAFSSIGLCLGISFIFYVLFAVSIAVGKGGGLPPFLAAWLSHIVFGSLAVFFFSRIP